MSEEINPYLDKTDEELGSKEILDTGIAGVQATSAPPKRSPSLPGSKFGCGLMVLILVLGTLIALVVSRREDSSKSSTTAGASGQSSANSARTAAVTPKLAGAKTYTLAVQGQSTQVDIKTPSFVTDDDCAAENRALPATMEILTDTTARTYTISFASATLSGPLQSGGGKLLALGQSTFKGQAATVSVEASSYFSTEDTPFLATYRVDIPTPDEPQIVAGCTFNLLATPER